MVCLGLGLLSKYFEFSLLNKGVKFKLTAGSDLLLERIFFTFLLYVKREEGINIIRTRIINYNIIPSLISLAIELLDGWLVAVY